MGIAIVLQIAILALSPGVDHPLWVLAKPGIFTTPLLMIAIVAHIFRIVNPVGVRAVGDLTSFFGTFGSRGSLFAFQTRI